MYTITHAGLTEDSLIMGNIILRNAGDTASVVSLTDEMLDLETQNYVTIVSDILSGATGTLSGIIDVALTVDALTDNTTGTPSATIPDAGATYSQSVINNINASFADEITKIKADLEAVILEVNKLND